MNIVYCVKRECFLYRIMGFNVRSGSRPLAYSHPNKWIRKRNINYNKIYNYGTA